jgi:hypothetical protein
MNLDHPAGPAWRQAKIWLPSGKKPAESGLPLASHYDML